MAKIKLNDALAALQGKFGKVVFKQINGKFFATRYAKTQKPRTEKQKAWNARFRRASLFAKAVKSDSRLRAFYEPIAQARNCRLREVVLSDAFGDPEITAVDFSGYAGQPGDVIRIRATDNYGVVNVNVWLRGPNGIAEFEKAAQEGQTDLWLYTATTAMPPDSPVKVRVVASDRPGNNAVHECVWPECVATPESGAMEQK